MNHIRLIDLICEELEVELSTRIGWDSSAVMKAHSKAVVKALVRWYKEGAHETNPGKSDSTV